jgi:hypothetical protein
MSITNVEGTGVLSGLQPFQVLSTQWQQRLRKLGEVLVPYTRSGAKY